MYNGRGDGRDEQQEQEDVLLADGPQRTSLLVRLGPNFVPTVQNSNESIYCSRRLLSCRSQFAADTEIFGRLPASTTSPSLPLRPPALIALRALQLAEV